jgi:hypothetical protein
MSFQTFVRLLNDKQLYAAVCILLVIVTIFVVWLMVDANAATPDKTQIGGITAGIAIFATITAAFYGWKLYRPLVA